MPSCTGLGNALAVAFLLIGSAPHALGADVNAGYDVYTAAQAMINLASHSWEWGTAAEALLELYNPELSVFSANPFPNGQVPSASASTFALEYAKQFIFTQGEVLVPDSAVGDPASLGVSAILLGQSNQAYLNAAYRQADYILNQAPKFSNGAISQRPDVAEVWADNMAMSFPFLAYLAVQNGSTALMNTVVTQCGLQRAVLKTSAADNWRHIIGPQSQDTGLWSTGNGWAGYGMVRVLYTLQKWSGSSSSMTSQASELKGWIKEILDGAMLSGFDGGLLHNYLDDASWFGEISGTAMLTAIAYRMAVNDPSTFGQSYITWADTNRKSLAQYQGSNGIFSPAVDPYSWTSRTEWTSGSPEGQAFTVYLYTAYRDCVGAGVCSPPATTGSTISAGGIGPFETVVLFANPVTFSEMPAPTGSTCGAPQSCDANGCKGNFNGLAVNPVCTAGENEGCVCIPTPTTCGAHQSCDLNGCSGAFNGLATFAQCTGNFVGCNCTATSNTCGAHQSCDLNGCAGAFNGLEKLPQCTGNFVGCNCTVTPNTCGAHQSCDLNGCAGAFNGIEVLPQCTGNFVGCNCTATSNTCGKSQSCDLNGCAGAFNGLEPLAQCTGNFVGCNCSPTNNTCGPHQSCDLNGCAGAFGTSEPFAKCTGNFVGCECSATPNTCGNRQSCDLNGCAGAFNGNTIYPQCTGNFLECECNATPNTCGSPQSCDKNNCAGQFNLNDGKAYCSENFVGCQCSATSNTCGTAQSCDMDNCAGKFNGLEAKPQCSNFFSGCNCIPTSNTCGAHQSCDNNGCAGKFPGSVPFAQCTGNFVGCNCTATSNTCGTPQSCTKNGCAGSQNSDGSATCKGNFVNCPCVLPSNPSPPPPPPASSSPASSPPPPPSGPPPLEDPWYCVGISEDDDENPGGITRDFSLAARNMNSGALTGQCCDTGIGLSDKNLCGANLGGAVVECVGDITQECAGYGVALYNSRTCRTFCSSMGDQPFCEDFFDGFHFSLTISIVLVCDRALS